MTAMNCIYIAAACFITMLLLIIIDEYRKSHCRHCGAKMNRHYDTEEDAEVWQCPKCGRSYIIR